VPKQKHSVTDECHSRVLHVVSLKIRFMIGSSVCSVLFTFFKHSRVCESLLLGAQTFGGQCRYDVAYAACPSN